MGLSSLALVRIPPFSFAMIGPGFCSSLRGATHERRYVLDPDQKKRGCVAALWVCCGCESRGPGVSECPEPILACAERVSLGVVRRDRTSRVTLLLKNQSARPLAVERIETSCPCVTVGPKVVRLAPGRVVKLTAVLDPSEEPDFRGPLSVSVVGRGGGRCLFRTWVDAEVR